MHFSAILPYFLNKIHTQWVNLIFRVIGPCSAPSRSSLNGLILFGMSTTISIKEILHPPPKIFRELKNHFPYSQSTSWSRPIRTIFQKWWDIGDLLLVYQTIVCRPEHFFTIFGITYLFASVAYVVRFCSYNVMVSFIFDLIYNVCVFRVRPIFYPGSVCPLIFSKSCFNFRGDPW